MDKYNIHDSAALKGEDFKYLLGVLSKLVDEVEQIKHEMIDLNTPCSILTAEEAAEFLRVSKRTVENWANDGIVPVHDLGYSSVRFKRKELEALLTRRDGKMYDPKQFKY